MKFKAGNFLKHKSDFRFFLLLFFICFVVYFNACSNGFLFIFDDEYLIINNPYIKQVNLFPRIFTVGFLNFSALQPVVYYRPIAVLTYALEYNIWKLNPFGYHLTNVILHAINSCLVYYLIFLLFGDMNLARLSSVLFCLHPIHQHPVSLIANRGDLLLSLFGLASIINYLLFARSSKIKNYLFSIIFFSLAVFTKENAVLILPLLCLCVYFSPKFKTSLKYFSPFVIVYFLYLYLRLILLKLPLPQYPSSLNFSLGFDILNFFNILTHYLGIFIYPAGLYYMHSILPIAVFSKQSFLVFIFWLIIGGLFLWSVKNNKKIIGWGIAWFLLGISFVIKSMHMFHLMGLKQLAMKENWLYLASIGLFAILGYIFIKLYRRIPKAAILLFICLSVVWSVLTIHYNSYGKNQVTFYKHILDYFPDNVPIRIKLAGALYPNNPEEAKRQFRIILDAWDTSQNWTDLLPDSCFGPGKTYSSREVLNQEIKSRIQNMRKLLEDK
jgi:hypothetical protein